MTHRRFLSAAVLLLLVLALAVPLAGPGRACAPVKGANQDVSIADESAIIIWDEDTKTQHFIRRASFRTSAADFGFLVPTPTFPERAEASDNVFTFLDGITKPKVVNHYYREPVKMAAAREDRAAAGGPGGVDVLAEGRVGSFDVVVLKAADAEALNDWLKKNNYQSGPELVKWFEPYVKAGWMMTAFKFAQDAAPPFLSTSAVRLTFKTDKPFFPYSEPGDMQPLGGFQRPGGPPPFGPPRLLRVYFIGTKRMAGVLGEDRNPWPGNTVWSNTITATDWGRLRADLKVEGQPVPADAWLTIFEDPSSPRPGTADVYFEPSGDQSTVKRPDIINHVYDPDGSIEARERGVDPFASSKRLVLILGGVGVLLVVVVGFFVLRRGRAEV
jgi:hypothetical protein